MLHCVPHFYSRTQIFVKLYALCSSVSLSIPDVLYFSLGDYLDRSWDLALDLENLQSNLLRK
jgi:hypothetical protein